VGRALVFLSVLLVSVLSATAQARGETHELDFWSPVFVQGDIFDLNEQGAPGNLGAFLEVQPRFHLEPRQELWAILVRPALYFGVAEYFTVWAGYGWTPRLEPDFVDEHRAWQQFQANLPLDEDDPGFAFLLRSRLEQRFIEDVHDTSLRFRQLVRFSVPIVEHFLFVTWDELFFTANALRRGPEQGFDQNRFFLGGQVRIDRKYFAFDVGYMNVYDRLARGEDVIRHVIQLAVYVGF
jgi:hypothetical protein